MVEPVHWADHDFECDPVDNIQYAKENGEEYKDDSEEQNFESNQNPKLSLESCSTLLTKRHIYSQASFFEPVGKFP